MKKVLKLLSFTLVVLCGAATTPVTANNTAPIASQQVDCYGTYEEGLAEGRVIRTQLINEYGENTPAFTDALAIERARASEQWQTVSRECRPYWRGILDGL
ncbi:MULTISPECIES: hypothetical protein [Hymenobacter]|uniref:Uncharacterized protein n=1 Tax=Hymenobacter mucosus TaxID=1411120 RepID=A0A238V7X6_9BACT|nr:MULTISPECIES: hypothetical protein [Hymenobacter]SNR29649.1 hypothetical protein SAMN06269173_101172 [Hymenobacter mucosus]